MKSLGKNITYNVIYQILVVLLPLITSPIVSRRLGPEMSGVYSYTYSIAYYFILFSRLGIGLYGNRTIARVRDDRYSMEKTFWELFAFQFLASAIMTCAYVFYCQFIVQENSVIAWIHLLAIIASMFDITWFLFGIEDFKWALIRNLVVKIVGFCLIVLFVKVPEHIWVYCLIMGGSTLAGQIIMWPYVLRKVSFTKPTISGVIKHFKPNLILFLPSIAISLYQVMDKIMLGWIRPKEEVGYYEYAEKIIAVLNSLVTAIETALIPRMSNLFSKDDGDIVANKYIRTTMLYVVVIASALIFGFAAVSRLFAPLYWGEEYEVAGTLIMILCPGVYFSVIGSVVRSQYMIPKSMDKEYTFTLFFGAFLNLVGNSFLIRQFGAVGASISTTVAECSMAVLQVWLVKRFLPLRQYLEDGIFFVLNGGLMFLIVYFLMNLMSKSIFTLLFLIILGGMIYISLSLIFMKLSKNSFIKENEIRICNVVKKLKEKII